MARIKVTVWHDIVTGEIAAIGQAMAETVTVAVAGDGQGVLETEIAEEDLASLPQTHLVDMSKRELVKRPYDTASG